MSATATDCGGWSLQRWQDNSGPVAGLVLRKPRAFGCQLHWSDHGSNVLPQMVHAAGVSVQQGMCVAGYVQGGRPGPAGGGRVVTWPRHTVFPRWWTCSRTWAIFEVKVVEGNQEETEGLVLDRDPQRRQDISLLWCGERSVLFEERGETAESVSVVPTLRWTTMRK